MGKVKVDQTHCDGCEFENPVGGITGYTVRAADVPPFPKLPPKALCEICASTEVGGLVEYPSPSNVDLRKILGMQAYCANQIRRDIQDLKGGDQ